MNDLFTELDRLEREDNRAWHAYVRAFSAHAAERTEANERARNEAWFAQKRTSAAVALCRARINNL